MTNPSFELPATTAVFTDSDTGAVPIHFLRSAGDVETIQDITAEQKAWINACAYKAGRRSHLLLPNQSGGIAAVLFGAGKGDSAEPCGPAEYLLGDLATKLPADSYKLGQGFDDREAAAIAWGLGAYKFTRYKDKASDTRPQLFIGDGINPNRIQTIAGSIWLGRDLINTPANDMGPEEIEVAARAVAGKHSATIHTIVGDQLLAENYPMIHAVGRASTRPPVSSMSPGATLMPRR